MKLDESSGTRVDSIAANNGTSLNSVGSVSDGKFSRAAHFVHDPTQGATTQRIAITVGSGNVLQRGDSSWFGAVYVRLNSKPTGSLDALDVSRTICGQWNTDNAPGCSWKLKFDGATDAFVFTLNSTGATASVSSHGTHGAIALNTWYLIQFGHDAIVNFIQIQVDGNPMAGLSTTQYALNSTEPLLIGSEAPSGSGALGWDGDIDDLLLWDQLLTGPQSDQYFNAGDGTELTDFDIHVVYEFCTAHPVTGEDIGEPLLEPLTLDESAEVERSRMPLYELVFKLHDMDQLITQILASDSLVGWSVAFYAGFYDIAWADNFVQLFGGIVTEVSYEDGAYTVTARNLLAAANDKLIFNGASTTLTVDVNSTDTTFPVADTSAFEYAAADPQKMRKLLECDGELLNYRDKDATNFLSIIRPGVTGFFVPPATAPSAAHSAGATVREMIKLTSLSSSNANAASDDGLHPIEQLKLILSDTGKYGIGESGISYNASNLNALKAALGAELQFRFIFAEGMNAKKFIEEEIFFPCGMYPICDNTGALGGKLFQGADDASPVDTITDDDITAQPKWVRNAEHMTNKIVVDLDYLPTTKEYKSQFIETDGTLIRAIGREIPLNPGISSKGIRSEFTFGGNTWFETTEDFLIDMAQRHIARFGVLAPVISVQALFTKQLLEIGDDIEVTLSHAINLGNGTRVLTDAPFEVVKLHHDFQAGTIQADLLAYPS